MAIFASDDHHLPSISFRMLDLWDADDAIEYVFLHNTVRFYVRVFADKVRRPGELFDQFQTFVSDINAPDMDGFIDWVWDAMEGVTGTLASASPTRNSVPLLDFFSPRTYAFELFNNEGRLCPVQVDYSPGEYIQTSPRVRLIDELPERSFKPPAQVFGGRRFATSETTILRSEIPWMHYPHFLASKLIKVDDGLEVMDLCNAPRKVRYVGTENVFFFKQALRENGLKRELEILNQINKMGEPVRTSRLFGLVFWDGEENVLMGFLLDCNEGTTLVIKSKDATTEAQNKWIGQVQSTLGLLHKAGLIWGDASPDNILIDQNGDAVIVDFGGGYCPEHIPQDLQHTKDGDLIAVKRMAEKMGVPIDE